MPAERVTMRKIKDLLRLKWACGLSSRQVAASCGEAETVLLVEDDKAVRTWLKKVLTRAGYRIIEAANGHQALQSSRTAGGPVHLLLTDLVMPELSGPEVAAQLTQEVPTLRVLYMSGYSDHPVFKTGGAARAIL